MTPLAVYSLRALVAGIVIGAAIAAGPVSYDLFHAAWQVAGLPQ